ncbi:MAG: N-6 DNA methylase [Chloroflexi bacterium]|nr:N-6 DNA methylase [Chloroflexota bacterium]
METMVLSYDDPNCKAAAAEILRRHEEGAAEANITSAVRDFLVVAGLAKVDEMVEENPPSEGSRRAVDLTALDTFIEFKRLIGNGIEPNPEYVQQLDDYLEASAEIRNGVRMGILTDGKYWVLRWSNASRVNTSPPYAFTLPDADRWFKLHEWLRDHALVARENIAPTHDELLKNFGPNSPSYERDIDELRALYAKFSSYETVAVKRRLWHDLLRTALGEVVESEEFDDLFVRHTYLTIVVGIVVQATFGMDVSQIAENDPEDLVTGRQFAENTGLHGVVESDFFAWPVEVGATALVRTIARRVARFDWSSPPSDIAATLYQTVIPAQERRDLGEYYTPRWLAKAIVEEIVTDPVNQRVLDPSCGSGTFLAECVEHFLKAAKQQNVPDTKLFELLRESVTGIDVHPVATHLARAAWVIAAKPAIAHSASTAVTVPIYLGDSLQLRYQSRDLFGANTVTIGVGDDDNTELLFPISLVNDAENFDQLMVDVADYIERGEDPKLAMEDVVGLTDGESATLSATIDNLADLHAKGRDHIWAYYTRNLVRPITLARNKVDVIVGNPPWINYNQTTDVLRDELVNQSRNEYGIWAGGRYATHQDVASLFYTRSVDLYLRDGGLIGMVMPHSALQAGQHTKWRTGEWKSRRGPGTLHVDFRVRKAWDLERLEPNDFFPVPSSVVFAKRLGEEGKARALAGTVRQWVGATGSANVRRVDMEISDTSQGILSSYASQTRQGSTMVPRVLFFVNEIPNPTTVRLGNTITTSPRRGVYDKEPWKSLDLPALNGNTIEKNHMFDAHLGETLTPYATLDPLKVIMPFKRGSEAIEYESGTRYGVAGTSLERRMRTRWSEINRAWENHKRSGNELSSIERIDYYGNLSSQLGWQRDKGDRPVRIVYNQSGAPTAAILGDDEAIVDYTLYWVGCRDLSEAHYLAAIINSDQLFAAVKPLMPKGQFGSRHLQKHLWRLPIPEFDGGNSLHVSIADAGRQTAVGVERELERLGEERPGFTVTIARREVRKWLRESAEGQRVEEVVGALLGGGVQD